MRFYSLSASANLGLQKINFYAALYGGYEEPRNSFTYTAADAHGQMLERTVLQDRMDNFLLIPEGRA